MRTITVAVKRKLGTRIFMFNLKKPKRQKCLGDSPGIITFLQERGPLALSRVLPLVALIYMVTRSKTLGHLSAPCQLFSTAGSFNTHLHKPTHTEHTCRHVPTRLTHRSPHRCTHGTRLPLLARENRIPHSPLRRRSSEPSRAIGKQTRGREIEIP